MRSVCRCGLQVGWAVLVGPDRTVLVCSSGTPTASTRPRVSGRRWRGRSGVRGWCSTTRSPPAAPPARPGEPYLTDAALSKALTRGQAHPGAGVAGRGVRRGAATGPGRREHRVPELLRLAHGQAQGPQGSAPPGSGPAGHGPVDPVHQERPVPGLARRAAAAAEDRGRAGALVAGPCRPSRRRSRSPWTRRAGTTPRSSSTARRPAPPRGPGGRDRPGPDPLRGPVRRREGRQPAPRAAAAAKLQAVAAGAVPQPEGLRAPGGPPQGRPRHARVADTRRDWLHKLSTTDHPRQPSGVRGGPGRVRAGPHPAGPQSVHDAGWSTFAGMLEYKAARYGRTFARVDRFFPSTRMCSVCGAIDEPRR